MTKLPEKGLLDGSKTPETTTGEFRLAMGNIRQFLFELFGDESSDKETARQTLGIDLTQLNGDISKKADKSELERKADRSELETKADVQLVEALAKELAKKGTPIGSVEYFALSNPPTGYLKADGSLVLREMYPDLFAAIGTNFGEGDGATTFNLPNLIGRFAEGGNMPGQYIEAGLPDINGVHGTDIYTFKNLAPTGVFSKGESYSQKIESGTGINITAYKLKFDASRANPIYANSDTVQPPALTLLPCVKAFHA